MCVGSAYYGIVVGPGFEKPEGNSKDNPENGQWMLVKDIADRLSKASNGAIQPDDGTLVKIGQFMSRPEYKFERDRCARGWTYWVKVL